VNSDKQIYQLTLKSGHQLGSGNFLNSLSKVVVRHVALSVEIEPGGHMRLSMSLPHDSPLTMLVVLFALVMIGLATLTILDILRSK